MYHVCYTITFESRDVRSSYLHIRCMSRIYGSGSYMKVIGSGSRLQKQKSWTSLFAQCETLIDHNSASIKVSAMRFAYIMGFPYMTDRMVRPPALLLDQK